MLAGLELDGCLALSSISCVYGGTAPITEEVTRWFRTSRSSGNA